MKKKILIGIGTCPVVEFKSWGISNNAKYHENIVGKKGRKKRKKNAERKIKLLKKKTEVINISWGPQNGMTTFWTHFLRYTATVLEKLI